MEYEKPASINTTSVIGLHVSDVSGGHVRRRSAMASAWLASTAAVVTMDVYAVGAYIILLSKLLLCNFLYF